MNTCAVVANHRGDKLIYNSSVGKCSTRLDLGRLASMQSDSRLANNGIMAKITPVGADIDAWSLIQY